MPTKCAPCLLQWQTEVWASFDDVSPAWPVPLLTLLLYNLRCQHCSGQIIGTCQPSQPAIRRGALANSPANTCNSDHSPVRLAPVVVFEVCLAMLWI